MRAMVYRGPYRVRVEEKASPRIEHPNDAIVRVTLAAICGSDLHLYHGMMPDTRVGTTFDDYRVFRSPVSAFLQRAAAAGLTTCIRPVDRGQTVII